MTPNSSAVESKTFNHHFLVVILSLIMLVSCSKPGEVNSNSHLPLSHSTEVLDKWMTIQLRLMRNATGIANHAMARQYAYSGIAALESLAPALPAHQKWTSKWNGLTGLPQAMPSNHYYFPANVNAALASMNRLMFPNASSADKAAIDSLELALYNEYLATQSQAKLQFSSGFGKAVAAAVFAWAQNDGSNQVYPPYVVPVGPGLWKPTPTSLSPPATPYWGQNRTIITGSTLNVQLPPPVAYSTSNNSAFYQMVKEVYDVSQNLTNEQKAIALFWRDVPGATSPGHWLSVLQQFLQQYSVSLDKGALAYALTGAAMNDALISCFQWKYHYNLVRPITYIREVMGHSGWISYIGTPAHPEYPSAHATLSAATADVLTKLFGNAVSITDHTYDYLGFAPRTYASFSEIAEEAAQSRLFAGIHYQSTINASLVQGRQVTANIFSTHITP